jgi:hypothetical protein
MFARFQVLTVLASAVLLQACGPANEVEVQNRPARPAGIQKGTEPVSTIASNDDLYLLAFTELGWNLRSTEISIDKISRNEQDGCIAYRRVDGSGIFATAQFNCTSTVAVSGSNPTHRKTITGRETYSEASDRSAFISMNSSFEQSLHQITNRKLVGLGSLTRALRVTRPALGQGSGEYPFNFSSSYSGKVAEESDRLGETWASTIEGEFTTSRASGDRISAGTQISLKYVPERPRQEKANKTINIQITATSDVTFVPAGSCLRPVGSFRWTLARAGSTSSGTLTTSLNGVLLSNAGGETIPWGTSCLER